MCSIHIGNACTEFKHFIRALERHFADRTLFVTIFPSTVLLQGDMEQALENYDICTEMLQSSTTMQRKAGDDSNIVIRLPNLHVDSVVSLEEVRIHLQEYSPCFTTCVLRGHL